MRFIVLLGLSMLLSAVAVRPARADDVDFTRDIRPILSRHCFKCHGPDEKARKAKLRLDVRDAAVKPARSGSPAIVPGRAAESEVVRRIFLHDREALPPPATRNSLSEH